MESHRHEQQQERRPSLTSRHNSTLELPSVLQPADQHQHEQLPIDTSGAMSCATKSRRSTPLLWAMLLAASILLSSTRGGVAARPTEAVAGTSHHLRRRAISLSTTIAAAAETRRLNVFGDDDRRPVSDPSLYPYSAVGLLRWSDSLSCTASLIADKFIVTAAECALDADGNVRKSSFANPKFLPGYGINKGGDGAAASAADDKAALVVKVHKQSDYWKKWTQNTYVILELDAPIGQAYGVLQLPSLADLDQSAGKTEVQIAGYDDKALDLTTASMQYAKCTCYFPSEFNGPQYMLLHDCDTSGSGSPGSPLLVRYTSMETYIIGIHSNTIGNASTTAVDTTKPLEFSQGVANRGVLGPFIQKQLDSLVSNSTASTSKSDDSSSMDNGGGDKTPATSPASSKPTSTPTPKPSADGRAGTDNGDLNPAATTPSTGESSAKSSVNQNKRITPAAAYICIAFVCLAWACILFIAVRHIRRGGAEADEVADDDDAERIEL